MTAECLPDPEEEEDSSVLDGTTPSCLIRSLTAFWMLFLCLRRAACAASGSNPRATICATQLSLKHRQFQVQNLTAMCGSGILNNLNKTIFVKDCTRRFFRQVHHYNLLSTGTYGFSEQNSRKMAALVLDCLTLFNIPEQYLNLAAPQVLCHQEHLECSAGQDAPVLAEIKC